MTPEAITPNYEAVGTCVYRPNVMEAWAVSDTAEQLTERAERLKVMVEETKAQEFAKQKAKDEADELRRVFDMIEAALIMSFAVGREDVEEDFTQPLCSLCGHHHA